MTSTNVSYSPRLYADGDPASDKPVLVLANSLGTTGAIWDLLIPTWTRWFRVIRFEYPGHGGTDSCRVGSVHDIASGLLDSLDREGVAHFHFCGVSMGGATGLAVAQLASHRLRSLVVSNSSTQFGPRDFWQSRIAQARANGPAAVAPATVARWLRESTVRQFPERYEMLLAMFSATDTTGYCDCATAVSEFDGEEMLSAVPAHLLVITGTDDKATPPAWGRAIHQRVPASRLAEIPSAHLASMDAPESFGRITSAFYAGLLGHG